MADFMRAQFSAWSSTDPKLDKVTNTVYFKRTSEPDISSPDWSGDAADILAAFTAGTDIYCVGHDRAQVKVYDMEDAEPRMPKATASANITTSAAGPREVALCLSFRGATNTARTRGRLYLGPFNSSNLNARPSESLRGAVAALAGRLANIGGTNIDWCVFSPTTLQLGGGLGDAFHSIQQSWVDDAWDTVRSRGIPPTTRTITAHSE